MELTIAVTGNKPMLQHNGRLANPLDPYTRKIKGISGKRKKTDDDLVEMAAIEARASCWETTDGLMGIPAAALWRSIYDGSKAFKLGEDIKRALVMGDETVPLLIDGTTRSADDHARESFDYRPVKIQRQKVMRARVRIDLPWAFTVTAELAEDVLDSHMLNPVYERAGRFVGIGDWRPIFGTYTIEVN